MSPAGKEAGAATRIAEPAADGDTTIDQVTEASRKRAAVELIRRDERTLRRTARRYSICADDADDAYQRSLEILLTKAPTDDPRQLIRWMQTVTKHEALAVRRHRERMLGSPTPPGRDDDASDWVQLIPSDRAGPADLTERRERIARSREALQALKPQELRALTLLAEGYSYAEISEITGWTRTYRLPGVPWTEFRTISADPRSGHYRLGYRFSDPESRGVRFMFRAFAPGQSLWPYLAAGSPPVAVRGR